MPWNNKKRDVGKKNQSEQNNQSKQNNLSPIKYNDLQL